MSSFPNKAGTAAEADEGVWPIRRRRILDWLVNETRAERFIDNILVQMCGKLLAAGVPVARATLHFRVNHPQWIGARILWKEGLAEAKIDTFAYGVENTPEFLTSPINAIHQGTEEVRRQLESITDGDSFYQELHDDGLTEYIAWPLEHTFGKRHVVTFSTSRAGGFASKHVDFLRDLLPALTLVSEIRLKNIMARTLLQTYVGPHASEQILSGVTTRGSGATVGAAIMICDLRDFTAISDLWPRDDVIHLLNDYFDAISDPVERYGGEILKFMGDGLLAIFPLAKEAACLDLLQAIREGQAAMAELNEEHIRMGREPLRYGVGVHVGDVMYGNIGSRRRLDFTVIGPAVNIASRLESLTKEVKRPVLLSRAFIEMAGCAKDMDSLGTFPLRGLGEPVDVFAFPEG
ncbi:MULTISPECIES: adenylate/guanylate cyclase domain-containing protein [unclassified Rhizobium]|uniref:adenylate/guanylate cyclase domain-containing protein n=1 Tax=unclassified Rhizobium TaxID=2613769 RepID=UPI001A9840E2|nr:MULTISPECIES: adenylate/guanylate cyclase domain-containing protein [unclassified Rhizobium]MBX5161880.1 adenylate/guanylate cyclase domain-containing protein [Rhizobium sp. NZLR8]MBX5168143.1 adenylate/guanylate cyclase domain-containing protein [Rhizobium sp. NZLR4b]MBX5174576.1 adenylate/guanylate cyclase domain-containing protein [Rhizobium sp. NZLR1b]MBX5187249.1 adenylate/guanylate cyclase domain-containing protein [Rhizobium sp. NZLR5]MBX5193581.1 adenylate/guanylate cyclase domain-c